MAGEFLIVLMWSIREWYLSKLCKWVEEWAGEQGFRTLDNIDAATVEKFKHVDIYSMHITRSLFCYKLKHEGVPVTALLTWDNLGAAYPEYYVVLFDLPLSKGNLFLRRETLSDRAEAALGKNDLDFENREFSDMFYVEAKPEKFAYSFFHPRMMELFLEEKGKKFDLYIRDGTVYLIKRLEVAPAPSLFRILFHRVIIPDWHEEGMKLMGRMMKLVPGHIKSRVAAEEKEGPVRMLKLECPRCGREFKTGEDAKKIKCPHCGVEGRI